MCDTSKRKRLRRKNRWKLRRLWAQEVRKHYQSLFNYALRLANGDRDRAFDLTQIAISRILTYTPRLGSIRSTRHYLCRILFHCWTDSKPRVEEVSLDRVSDNGGDHPVLTFQSRTQKNLEQGEIASQVLAEMVDDNPELPQVLCMKMQGHNFNEMDKILERDAGFAKCLWRAFVNKSRKLMKTGDCQKPRLPAKAKSKNEKPAA